MQLSFPRFLLCAGSLHIVPRHVFPTAPEGRSVPEKGAETHKEEVPPSPSAAEWGPTLPLGFLPQPLPHQHPVQGLRFEGAFVHSIRINSHRHHGKVVIVNCIFSGFCSKVPQTGGLKTMEVLSPTVLAAWSLNQGIGGAGSPWRLWGSDSPQIPGALGVWGL